jgi:hypothetical protein
VSALVLTEVRRSIPGSDIVSGCIIERNEKYILLNKLDDSCFFDGYSLIRAKDVLEITDVSGDGFQVRALEIMKSFPQLPPGVDTSTIFSAISSFQEIYDLITIHLETRNPDVCFIGQVVEVNEVEMQVKIVTPNAKFESKLRTFKLSKITRLEWGGLYEKALGIVIMNVTGPER